MDPEPLRSQVSGIAALDHPISRRVYQLVIDRVEVGRDAAAEALQVARSVAAFHLDKLVDAGLLVARFERTTGRTGPGAGRPAKLYARSAREIDLSIPPRRYDLAGSLLAGAIARATDVDLPISEALSEVARSAGARIGEQVASGATDLGQHAVLVDALARHGYEPRDTNADSNADTDGGTAGAKPNREIALLNCPFHSLAEQHRALVCSMNLELLTGMVAGLGAEDSVRVRLAPEPGYCCVRLDEV